MPSLPPFKLERYFAQYEFNARYLLSSSDCEAVSLAELLHLADAESRALWENLSLGYTESAGHPVLRQAIAQLYTDVAPDEVLACAPVEAIFITMHALLHPGDQVVTIFPAYQALYEVARALGCEVTPWPVEARDGRWQLDVERLAQLISPRTRLLVVNFPHNPTGYLPDGATFDAVLTLARRHDLHVFSDEMYRWLEHDPAQRLPSACESYDKAITLSGLSKTFGLPGLRSGWLASRDRDLLNRCQSIKDYTTICQSAPSEVLAIMALRARQALAARSLAIVRQNLAHAEAFFARHAALFRWFPPQAGSVAFPEWLGKEPIEDVADALVTQAGVMIVPGALFDSPGHHFRVGLGRRNFPQALERLGQFLNDKGYADS
jgi:aspartate/methionine/tyrosine aminotransferase